MQDNTAKPFLDPGLVSLMKEEVNRTKEAELPVNRAFETIAEKSGLKYNTVRNYYYRYIYEKANMDTDHSGEKGKDVANTTGRAFTDSEVQGLVRAMLIGQGEGKSVRGCANELAQNDYRLMLRYQNKYRNVLAGNPKYIENMMKELSEEGKVYYNPFTKEIIRGTGLVSEDRMFEIIGKMVSNISEINSRTLDSLLMGLYELSDLALRYKREGMLNRIETSPHSRESSDTGYRLAMINKDFIELPVTDKLSGLSRYIDDIENCIRDMGIGI